MLPRWVWDYIRTMNNGVHGHYYEVRGWITDVISQRYPFKPSISDIVSPCPTKRDVWLRRVHGTRIDHGTLAIGRIIHRVFMEGFKHGYRGLDIERVYGFKNKFLRSELRSCNGLLNYKTLSKVFDHGYIHGYIAYMESIPISIEPSIPGSLIGLSDIIKPDFMTGFIPIELTTGTDRVYLDLKTIGLTGYALAIEAWTGNPVDYGVLIQIRLRNCDINYRVIRIGDSLRKRFIELRDNIARMISLGEEPEKPPKCPEYCPYYEICGVGL